ncbi:MULTISPECIES: 50S ribosomal protein L9 [Corynebacterium]|uniref:Large ribosomal subunit protein bL9 n=2 Tax=Corynebacterium glucuronolyticum TaxID=39791 RepID=A0AAX1L873_9CORY|nr:MULTISPECIES: 50S ribosomal protein L9 [Corynebacterium]MDU3078920.1 50S ribosomal protein L9 [Mixta calida]EEI27647.1 ribosomal protein L9 [Corynebacterium glucuronolyticum ATCC 51867]EEI63781.1 ribosomal protein L9 [Corynebacterium glucuronolyticum ATCC 51866]MCT1443390.1 50S ribosomal protein L9 [Corynebacterium glucuronolyticum]MCT1564397.1 50S ribosomal protein L9 [Corynebacterium glucuronolyticum]
MKLILNAAVDNLGVAGDIVEVKPGYGRNYLLPRGLAIVATPGAEKQIEEIKKAREARAISDREHAIELKQQLQELKGVTISVRTSESGKLFGSVKADDIAKAVKAAGGPLLEKRAIEVPKGLVTGTGKYNVLVNLHDDVSARVNFEVVSA